LDNKIRQDSLYQELTKVLKGIDLMVVDVRKSENRGSVHVVVTITNKEHSVGVDECAKAHRLIYPRLTLLENSRNIDLEVSTPGLQRNFKDLYEFELFSGRRVRVYDSLKKEWVEGIISKLSEIGVELENARFDDSKESLATYIIAPQDVQKAKLAYSWEDM